MTVPPGPPGPPPAPRPDDRPAADPAAEAALAWLFSRLNYEVVQPATYTTRTMAVGRMERLLARLGDPHRMVPIVHIAGTKGKGSTAADVHAIATAAGLVCGLYTSPHLETVEERYRVGDEQISRERLVGWIGRVRPAVAAIDAAEAAAGRPGSGPTFFDITTAIAFLEFADRACDLAVIEVGLGGRLDSTNVCRPLVTIVTSISLDHMAQLGDTLAAIAGEKAGIIKARVPVISGVTTPEARAVIEAVAAERRAPVWTLGTDFHVDGYRPGRAADAGPDPGAAATGLTVDYRLDAGRLADHPDGSRLDGLVSNLSGRHQADNLALAVTAALVLADRGFPLDEAAIRRGLADARCPGRIEVLSDRPRVILDTAHNPASIAALIETLATLWGEGDRLLVFAVSRDKPWQELIAMLAPRFDRIIVTRFTSNARAVEPEQLAAHLAGLAPGPSGADGPDERPPAGTPVAAAAGRSPAGPLVEVAADPDAAWGRVAALATARTTVVLTGSFFLAAELRALVRARPLTPAAPAADGPA